MLALVLLMQSIAFYLSCAQYSEAASTTSQTAPTRSKWTILKKAGDASYEAGNYAEAEEKFKAASVESDKFEETDKRRAMTTYNLALALQTQEKYAEAEPYYRQAINLLSQSYGPDTDRVAQVYQQLAEMRKMQDDMKGAEELYQQSLPIFEKAYGEKAQLTVVLDAFGDFYADQEEFDKAEPQYLRAIDISRKTIGANKLETAKREVRLADMYCLQGKFTQAEPLYQTALKTSEDAAGPESEEVGKIAFNYGSLLLDQSQYPEAEAQFRQAIKVAEICAPTDIPLMEASLGKSLDMQKKYAEAQKTYLDAISRCEQTGDNATLIQCLKNYFRHFDIQNKKDDAAKIASRLKDIRSKVGTLTPRAPRSTPSQRPAAPLQLDTTSSPK